MRTVARCLPAFIACCSLQAAFADASTLKGTSLADCLGSLYAGPGGTDVLVAREAHWLPIVPSLGIVWRF